MGGVRVSVHWSWLICIIIWTLLDYRPFTTFWWRAGELLILFIVVLMHELGHVIAARREHVPVREIVLWPLGGVVIGTKWLGWKAELLVVSAGPLVNLVLTPLLFGLWYWVGYHHGGDESRLLWEVAWANVGMLIFNLLPIWPLDGGRLVQSAMNGWMGIARSYLVSGMLGIFFATVGMVMFMHVGNYLAASVLVALIFVCMSILLWAMNMLAAESHWGLNRSVACPECGSNPFNAPTVTCDQCGARCNLFSNNSRCWNCDYPGRDVICQFCGTRSPVEAWRLSTPEVAAQVVSTEFIE
jgi:Zn-dependent protease